MDYLRAQEHKKVADFLEYKTPRYIDRDWDNIPPVVSRFLIHIDKYMHGFSKVLSHENSLETTADLREYASENFSDVRKEAYGNNVKSKQTDDELQISLNKVDVFSKKLRRDYDPQIESIYYPNKNEKLMLEYYRTFIAQDKDEEDEDSDTSEHEMKQNQKKRSKDI